MGSAARWFSRLMHGLGPLAPPAGWEMLRAVQSHMDRRALVLTPPHRRVLVLAPHPDDEVIGCGGTTALVQARGGAVRTVIASRGELFPILGSPPEAVAARRMEDARRAASVLGVAPPVFLGLPDGGLAESVPELSRHITDHVVDFRPDAVYAPWLLDGHPDHRAAARALALASVPEDTEIWGYEVWASLPANRVVDITGVIDRKERALAEHAGPAEVFDMTAHLALNRWRSAHSTDGAGFCEAFLALPFGAYRALAERGGDGADA